MKNWQTFKVGSSSPSPVNFKLNLVLKEPLETDMSQNTAEFKKENVKDSFRMKMAQKLNVQTDESKSGEIGLNSGLSRNENNSNTLGLKNQLNQKSQSPGGEQFKTPIAKKDRLSTSPVRESSGDSSGSLSSKDSEFEFKNVE